MVHCEYGLPTNGAGVVFREPTVDAVDVELVGAGQAAQLVALGVLVDADAACSAQLPLQTGLTVSTCGQIVNLLFGQAPRVFVILFVVQQEELGQPEDGQSSVLHQVVSVSARGPALRGAHHSSSQSGLPTLVLLGPRWPHPLRIGTTRTNLTSRVLVGVNTTGWAGVAICTTDIYVAGRNSFRVGLCLHKGAELPKSGHNLTQD